jgi:hypothetical protein
VNFFDPCEIQDSGKFIKRELLEGNPAIIGGFPQDFFPYIGTGQHRGVSRRRTHSSKGDIRVFRSEIGAEIA